MDDKAEQLKSLCHFASLCYAMAQKFVFWWPWQQLLCAVFSKQILFGHFHVFCGNKHHYILRDFQHYRIFRQIIGWMRILTRNVSPSSKPLLYMLPQSHEDLFCLNIFGKSTSWKFFCKILFLYCSRIQMSSPFDPEINGRATTNQVLQSPTTTHLQCSSTCSV